MKPLPEEGGRGCRHGEASAGFLTPAVLGFFLLGLAILLRHEMWQDEWQAWLIARESLSLPDLFRNLRHEGHPGLWHLGLFAVSRVTSNPLGMQLLHLLVATCSVYVFLRYSPFTRLQKILFIFGYFPFYEYAVISRNYALGVLGLFSFCAVFCRPRPRNYLFLGVILFFLCQTSVYGLMQAMVLGLVLLAAAVRDRAVGTWGAIGAYGLILFGIALSVSQLLPPPDSGFAVGWHFAPDLPRVLATLATVWQSYVPLPAPDYHFWGTNLISGPGWQALLAVILLACGLLLFRRQPFSLLLYAVGTAGLLAFTYVKYPGSLRHHGHLYLLFIAGLWLASGEILSKGQGGRGNPAPTLADFCQAHRDRVVTVLLAVHLLAGAWAASLDLLFPFSGSRDAAGFIRQRQLDRMLILGHADDAASSVGGYLGRQIYYPASRTWGSFVIWNQERKPELKPGELVAQARELSRWRGQDVLLLLNYDLPPGRFPVIPLEKFTNSLVPVENYYLYLLPAAVE